MKSPADMRIILIDITNACVHQCSNCTRFCGHHKKPFFMDFETFIRAVDSMDGFKGTVGLIGGEPTLHPDFDRMVRYIGEKRGEKVDFGLYRPQRNFMDAVHDVEMSHTYLDQDNKRMVYGGGVWSVMGDAYKKHYEVIQDYAKYQALNDHSNPMYHKPALISRKELGISDKDWPAIRDNCWVVDVWSANITPKGAFFCEVAGCLDMLFDGPGGWPIEPGWWKRKPEEFGDQLKWCEICGMACETFTRDANEGIDDVSPTLYEKLKEIGSRKVANGKVNVIKIKDGVIAEESKAAGKSFKSDMPYVEHYNDRFDMQRSNLYYKEFIGVHVCNSKEQCEEGFRLLDEYKELYIYAHSDLYESVTDVPDGVRFFDADKHTIGYVIWKALDGKDHNTYLVYISGDVEPGEVYTRLREQVLNPGVMMYREYSEDTSDQFFTAKAGAEVALLNGIAYSLKLIGWDRVMQITSMVEMKDCWIEKKVLEFSPEEEGVVPVSDILEGKRYVVFGAGSKAEEKINQMHEYGAVVVALADPKETLQGRTVCGFVVKKPDEAIRDRSSYDKVMIAIGPHYKAVKDYLISKDIPIEDIAWI